MKLRARFFAAFFGLSMMVAHTGSAQPLQPLDYEPEWLQQMYSQGWQKVEEGVLQRGAEEGQIETFTYGVEGLQWVVEGYEQKIVALEEWYAESPDEKLAELIQSLRDQVEALNIQILTAPAAEELQGEVLDACSFSFDAPVFAGPSQSSQGVMATAQAVWQNDCNYQGEVYAYAYAHAKDGTVDNTSFDLPPLATGASVQVSAIASVVGSTECNSTASARVTVPALSINYMPPPAENYSCSAPPVVASISGPATVTTDSYVSSGCANVTWTASATGGSGGGYTYNWYLVANGTSTGVQATGSTFTKSYCNTSGNVTVKVVASDSGGRTDDATYTTSLVHRGPITATITGPTAVGTNTATPCANVTWTASASSSGHSGFTYNWYIGTTLQGSGTTLTKQYCSTSQSVTVKVVARASDGHESEATRTTTITHTNTPPTASITGPTSVALATSTECKSLTWTASATGGSGGYTYSWTIGTSTTVQGTAATLTKSYCGPQTINVKVVVRDSATQTDDATHTTTLTYSTPPTVSITGGGPLAGQLSSPGGCKSITWTANATGGTPGYTYRWYIGTSTTIEGTASTLTKTYCGEQTINVKVVVQDAAGQTAEATKTTTLFYLEEPTTGTCGTQFCSPTVNKT